MVEAQASVRKVFFFSFCAVILFSFFSVVTVLVLVLFLLFLLLFLLLLVDQFCFLRVRS